MKYYETKKFKQQQAKWYKKLKDKGFKEIEQTPDNESGFLRQWDGSYFKTHYTAETLKAKQDFYRIATHYIESGHFDYGYEKIAWSRYVEGASYEAIAKEINVGIVKVWKILRKLRKQILGIEGKETKWAK